MVRVALPIKFPSIFPDLVLTSWKRGRGSHASGHSIDVQPLWADNAVRPNIKKGSPDMFMYFYMAFHLFDHQKEGITRFAVPKYGCAHFHLEYRPHINKIGYEYVTNTGKGCQVMRTDSGKANIVQFSKTAKEQGAIHDAMLAMAEEYVTYYDLIAFAAQPFKESRQVYVICFDEESASAVRAITEAMYTDSTSAMIMNNVANELGYNNTGEIKEAIKEKTIDFALIGIVAAVIYFIYKNSEKGLDDTKRIKNIHHDN